MDKFIEHTHHSEPANHRRGRNRRTLSAVLRVHFLIDRNLSAARKSGAAAQKIFQIKKILPGNIRPQRGGSRLCSSVLLSPDPGRAHSKLTSITSRRGLKYA